MRSSTRYGSNAHLWRHESAILVDSPGRVACSVLSVCVLARVVVGGTTQAAGARLGQTETRRAPGIHHALQTAWRSDTFTIVEYYRVYEYGGSPFERVVYYNNKRNNSRYTLYAPREAARVRRPYGLCARRADPRGGTRQPGPRNRPVADAYACVPIQPMDRQRASQQLRPASYTHTLPPRISRTRLAASPAARTSLHAARSALLLPRRWLGRVVRGAVLWVVDDLGADHLGRHLELRLC